MNKQGSSSSGFTLFEIIIAMFIISIAVVPMVKSFGPAMMAAGSVEKTAVMVNQARGTMERLLALDFDTLSSEADKAQPLSGNDIFGDLDETFTFKNDSYSPEIILADASGDASKTLLDLTVTIYGMSITTKKANY